MYFQYDTSGTPFGFIYNDVQYFYITNQSGDVIAVTNKNGDAVGEYEYDEWGNILRAIGTSKSNQAVLNANPFRYRGYYYDTETGYYYLQSRYYDPTICRFINADSFKIAQQYKSHTNALNIFIYCANSPIYNSDPTGYSHYTAYNSMDEAATNFATTYYNVSKYIKFEISSVIYIYYIGKKVYYAYTPYIVGEAHSCTPLDGKKNVPSKGCYVAVIHTHPNSENFSPADKNFTKKSLVSTYVATPKGKLRSYKDTRRGYKESLVKSNLKYSSISKSTKNSLKKQYEKKWKNHIKTKCGFNCDKKGWPG